MTTYIMLAADISNGDEKKLIFTLVNFEKSEYAVLRHLLSCKVKLIRKNFSSILWNVWKKLQQS